MGYQLKAGVSIAVRNLAMVAWNYFCLVVLTSIENSSQH